MKTKKLQDGRTAIEVCSAKPSKVSRVISFIMVATILLMVAWSYAGHLDRQQTEKSTNISLNTK